MPATWPAQPQERATSTHRRAADATPDARLRAFNAVRSPSSNLRAGPVTAATATLPFDTSIEVPSSTFQATRHPNSSKVASKKGRPARTPLDLHQSVAVVSASPTTRPPTSSDGQSSLSHAATVSR